MSFRIKNIVCMVETRRFVGYNIDLLRDMLISDERQKIALVFHGNEQLEDTWIVQRSLFLIRNWGTQSFIFLQPNLSSLSLKMVRISVFIVDWPFSVSCVLVTLIGKAPNWLSIASSHALMWKSFEVGAHTSNSRMALHAICSWHERTWIGSLV